MLAVFDLGGSSAKVSLFNPSTKIELSSAVVAPYPSPQRGLAACVEFLADHIQKFNHSPTHVCVGGAGLGTREAREELRSDLAARVSCKLYICTDAELALWNAAPEGEALCLILGTGSIFMGRSRSGARFRYGGNGALFDSISGGFKLAQNYLSALAASKAEPNEREAFLQLTACKNVEDALRRINRERDSVRAIAATAPIVLGLSASRQPLAAEVTSAYIATICNETSRILEREKFAERRLFATGGMLKSDHFCESLKNELNRDNILFSPVLRSNTFGGLNLFLAGEFRA